MKNLFSLFVLTIAIAALAGCDRSSNSMPASDVNTNSVAATNAVDMTTNAPPR